MKSIFDTTPKKELIERIKTLDAQSKAQWGHMNVYQMVKHCTLWEEMLLSKIKVKRVFIGRLIGKLLLKSEVKDDRRMVQNTPTVSELKVKDTNVDLQAEKEKWISLIEESIQASTTDFVHPFFGKMTKEEIGIHHYKHIDHHLRQFNS
ncbi:MAG: DUF1569 domain-containing protein [Cytophagaceae bacterium]|nr:DUF1569 domain-containing protein [Cytophagaceae bacterium]